MVRGTVCITRRLRLRTWRLSDVAAYHKHCNTEQVLKYLGGVMPRSAVEEEVRWLKRQQLRDGHTFWAMERSYDAALLGFCGIIRVRERHTPLAGMLEIGWRLRADMWGRGYAYEAAEAVIDWAEWEMSGEALYARIHRHNIASQALARKLGMRRTRAMEARQGPKDRELEVFKVRL